MTYLYSDGSTTTHEYRDLRAGGADGEALGDSQAIFFQRP
jgi:hypothetical protein